MNPKIDDLRRKVQQLQALHDSGSLSDQAFLEARQPLDRELVDEVMRAPSTSPEPAPSRRLGLSLAFGVFVLAALGYAFTGSPGGAGFGLSAAGPQSRASAQDGSTPVNDQQVDEIVERVAQRLKDKPDDPVGWALLARAYSAMGRYGQALPAFKKALALGGEDATLMADYADTLAANNNGRFDAAALKLVERALVLDPANIKALALAGSAAFDNRDFATAIRQWEKVESSLPADSPMLAQVRSSITQARQQGAMPAASAAAVLPAGSGASAATNAAAVSGRVSLAGALATQANPDDTVFILARAANGPRMPLAVLRKQVKDLPLNFTLDDSMAMAANARISDHAQVVVSARVSKSGDAMPGPGDLTGQSAPVTPGTRGIVIEISQALGK